MSEPEIRVERVRSIFHPHPIWHPWKALRMWAVRRRITNAAEQAEQALEAIGGRSAVEHARAIAARVDHALIVGFDEPPETFAAAVRADRPAYHAILGRSTHTLQGDGLPRLTPENALALGFTSTARLLCEQDTGHVLTDSTTCERCGFDTDAEPEPSC